MTSTELKQNITQINKLLSSDNYEAGIELIKTLNNPEITKGTLKEVLKHSDYFEAGIKSVKTLDVSFIDEKIIKLLLKIRDFAAIDIGIELARTLDVPSLFEMLLKGCSINREGKLVKNKIFTGTGPAQPYLDYALWNLIGYASEDAQLDTTIDKKHIKLIKITPSDTNSNFPQNTFPLPCGVFQLRELEILDLSDNKITSLPTEIGNLIKLKRLDLQNNYLTSLPKEIFQLKNASIDLSGNLRARDIYGYYSNKIGLPDRNCQSVIDGWINSLESEHYCSILKNYIYKDGKFELKNKNGFIIDSKYVLFKLISKCPDKSDIDKSMKPENITCLDLNGRYMDSLFRYDPGGGIENYGDRISSLPPEVNRFKNLIKLDLSNNYLDKLPSEIASLSKLKFLSLKSNCFSAFPKEVVGFTKLEILDLNSLGFYRSGGTVKIEIPKEIVNLKNISTLSLRGNSITKIPTTIGKLKKIEILDLGSNLIESMPSKLWELKNLKELDFYSDYSTQNHITLRLRLIKLSLLTKLNLYMCKISIDNDLLDLLYDGNCGNTIPSDWLDRLRNRMPNTVIRH